MEQALCLLSRQQPSPMAPALLPVFLTLRRTFLLPPSNLPPKLVDAFIEQLDPPAHEEPYREPTLQSTTSSLYVNPRLDDSAAFRVLEELIVYETDMLKNAQRDNEVPSTLLGLIDNVKLRVSSRIRQVISADNSFRTVPTLAYLIRQRCLHLLAPPKPATVSPNSHQRTAELFLPSSMPPKKATLHPKLPTLVMPVRRVCRTDATR